MNDGEMKALARSDDDMLLSELRQEHRKLDAEIEAMQLQGENDFRLMALKRRKLQLKDEIAWIMAKSRPDIIA